MQIDHLATLDDDDDEMLVFLPIYVGVYDKDYCFNT
jgi:hypothetical protein